MLWQILFKIYMIFVSYFVTIVIKKEVMSDIAIRADVLGKRYRIGRKKSGEFRESFGNLIQLFKSKAGSQQLVANSSFWALRDISFEVKQGEAVGIIGRNGAGKSTLLKVLSRITKPTTGRFEINGRVSSLLEVGTGFHPELTGRENIFLNGTILGMRRAEIKSKFDEIIDFSGVEEFIDTPVKHYSSGMKVRLAFSVAAHLEPEILIIDEVLAVGDAEFQKKCLGKMEDVTGEGRTVLFVSHNMGAVRNLCQTGIVLQNGQSVFKGAISNAIAEYQNLYIKSAINNYDLSSIRRTKGKGSVIFNAIRFASEQINYGEPICFAISIGSNNKITSQDMDFAVAITNSENTTLIHGSNRFIHKSLPYDGKAKNLKIKIDNILRPGRYYITLFLRINGIIEDWLNNIASFTIEDSSPYPFNNNSEIQGLIFPEYTIDIQ